MRLRLVPIHAFFRCPPIQRYGDAGMNDTQMLQVVRSDGIHRIGRAVAGLGKVAAEALQRLPGVLQTHRHPRRAERVLLRRQRDQFIRRFSLAEADHGQAADFHRLRAEGETQRHHRLAGLIGFDCRERNQNPFSRFPRFRADHALCRRLRPRVLSALERNPSVPRPYPCRRAAYVERC